MDIGPIQDRRSFDATFVEFFQSPFLTVNTYFLKKKRITKTATLFHRQQRGTRLCICIRPNKTFTRPRDTLEVTFQLPSALAGRWRNANSE